MLSRIAQVTVRDAVKPGRGGANLLSNSFKFNRDCYYCISREKPDIMWIECIKDKKDINLKFFRARDTTSYPENFQPFMDHGDNVDESASSEGWGLGAQEFRIRSAMHAVAYETLESKEDA